MSPRVVILASLLSSSVTSLSLVGYKFTDNLLEKRFGPDNGYITFKVDRVPHQISACFRIYIDFRRFSYQGYMDFSKEGQPEHFTTITSKEILSCAPASPATENMILYKMNVQIKEFGDTQRLGISAGTILHFCGFLCTECPHWNFILKFANIFVKEKWINCQ